MVLGGSAVAILLLLINHIQLPNTGGFPNKEVMVNDSRYNIVEYHIMNVQGKDILLNKLHNIFPHLKLLCISLFITLGYIHKEV